MISRHVGFDLDGVVALTHQSIFDKLQAKGLILNRKYHEAADHYLEKAFPNEVSYDDVALIMRDNQFWKEIPVCEFLSNAVRDCRSHGLHVHIITARNDETAGFEDITKHWLWYNSIGYDTLAFVPARQKAHYCVEHRLDFMIEDRLDTTIAIANTLMCQGYLVATPYNTGMSTLYSERPTHPLVTRMSRPYFCGIANKHYGSSL